MTNDTKTFYKDIMAITGDDPVAAREASDRQFEKFSEFVKEIANRKTAKDLKVIPAPFNMMETTLSLSKTDLHLSFRDRNSALEVYEWLEDNADNDLAFVVPDNNPRTSIYSESRVYSLIAALEKIIKKDTKIEALNNWCGDDHVEGPCAKIATQALEAFRKDA